MSTRSTTPDFDYFENETLLEKGSYPFENQYFEPNDLFGPKKRNVSSRSLLERCIRSRTNHFRCILLVVIVFVVSLHPATLSRIPKACLHRRSLNGCRNLESIRNLVVFGDSYSSKLEDLEPSPPYLVKSQINDNGSYKSTPNWITFLTEVYNTTAHKVYNFATEGSTIDSGIVKPYYAGTSLKDQLREFSYWYGSSGRAAQWQPENTLFVFWFGVDDILASHDGRNEEDVIYTRPPLPYIFNFYSDSVNKLYEAGARNFLFLTVPPIYLSHDHLHDVSSGTTWRVDDKLDEIRDVDMFNARLFEMREDLRRKHRGIYATVFDIHRFWTRVLETPGEFQQTQGLTHAVTNCKQTTTSDYATYLNQTCMDGSLLNEHAFTELHATYPMHNVTAAQVAKDCFAAQGPMGYCS